jgi:hypothetical protein
MGGGVGHQKGFCSCHLEFFCSATLYFLLGPLAFFVRLPCIPYIFSHTPPAAAKGLSNRGLRVRKFHTQGHLQAAGHGDRMYRTRKEFRRSHAAGAAKRARFARSGSSWNQSYCTLAHWHALYWHCTFRSISSIRFGGGVWWPSYETAFPHFLFFLSAEVRLPPTRRSARMRTGAARLKPQGCRFLCLLAPRARAL